jgi:hypothetical protein
MDDRDEVTGWRPIETAPKDGTEVLAWEDSAEKLFYEEDMGAWVDHEYIEYHPTHWMPLPEPPETT